MILWSVRFYRIDCFSPSCACFRYPSYVIQVKHYDDRKRRFTVVYADVNVRKRHNYDRIRAVEQTFGRHRMMVVFHRAVYGARHSPTLTTVGWRNQLYTAVPLQYSPVHKKRIYRHFPKTEYYIQHIISMFLPICNDRTFWRLFFSPYTKKAFFSKTSVFRLGTILPIKKALKNLFIQWSIHWDQKYL